jgi:hypothetical protein
MFHVTTFHHVSHQSTICISLLPRTCQCLASFILLGIITRLFFRQKYRSRNSSMCNILYSLVTFCYVQRFRNPILEHLQSVFFQYSAQEIPSPQVYVLFIIFYLLCSIHYIIFIILYLLYSIYYILFMFYLLYSIYYIPFIIFYLCSIYYIIFIIFSLLCSIYCALFIIFYLLYSIYYIIFIMFYLLCSIYYILFIIFYLLYSTLNVRDQVSHPHQTSKIMLMNILVTESGNRKFKGRNVAGIFWI